MIVKIQKSDIDAVKFVCALHDLTCDVYTIESPDALHGDLTAVEIKNDGKELLAGMAFYIGRSVEIKLDQIRLSTKV